ncbi:hypothetical protein HPB47_008703 [Ixodes persulcatus]|uniref:Uncharacterized protein n=1 Tax=Ixodes persulcatus TaxID=34615 RepID=A0AC60P406_IXOPE|nr:hypothetical protein HPB47_008703 [Ixodes persulcatus]
MQLTLLLMLQVLTVHGSAALFDAGFAEAVLAYLPKPSSITSPGLHVSASHDGATVIAADNPCPDKPFATDLLIAFNQRDPRDPTQGYIRAGDFSFVGFGAGTLSDMQLTLLLMLQRWPARKLDRKKAVTAERQALQLPRAERPEALWLRIPEEVDPDPPSYSRGRGRSNPGQRSTPRNGARRGSQHTTYLEGLEALTAYFLQRV